MARYFFHRTDGGFDRDSDGTELDGIAAARLEAVRYAAATLTDRPSKVWEGHDFRIEVTDDRGMLLCAVIVLGIDAPVARRELSR